MKGTGYPVTIVSEARRLGEAGWTGVDIQRIMRRERGLDIPHRTVSRWLNAESAERDLERNRRRKRASAVASARFTLRGSSREYKAAFIRRLRQEGIPKTSIAKVCTVVFDEPVSRDEVNRILRSEG